MCVCVRARVCVCVCCMLCSYPLHEVTARVHTHSQVHTRARTCTHAHAITHAHTNPHAPHTHPPTRPPTHPYTHTLPQGLVRARVWRYTRVGMLVRRASKWVCVCVCVYVYVCVCVACVVCGSAEMCEIRVKNNNFLPPESTNLSNPQPYPTHTPYPFHPL